MPNIAVSQLSSHQPGEDYINKSLLDSLDAQADAEPISSSSESEQPAPASYGSNSNSSSGSPSAPYHFAVQPQQQQQQQPQHLTRSDSPSDNNNQAILHRLHSQDPLYNMHGQHSNYYPHSHSANNMHMTSEYGSEYDAQKQSQHSGKVNDSYKTSHGSYPITTRMRHHTNQHTALNSAQYRDTSSFYPSSAADVYPPTQVTSPIQSHMQPFDPRASYDFNGGRTDMGVGPKSYLMENYASSATIMQSVQQPGKPNVVQQTPLNGYASNGQYINGIQLSSQTPYGPHVPSNGHISAANGVSANAVGAPPGLSATSAMNMANGHGSSANQEEISTIFVVGFPDDMQEREFQNMFTFSPGFEAATLKIPNKEYTSYGGMAMNGVPAPLRSSYQGYTGSNDPYNLVTVNQGGVVVDGGRDGTMASWPSSTPIEENASNGNHFVGGINMAPRKQIIGFAKFKSREEALHARDVLQGRRVDIEKGAVLKAEMAKKNLHTKRGVGPVPTSLHGINGTVTNGPVSGTGSSSVIGSSNSLGGMQHNMINGSALGGSAGADVYGLGTNDSVSAREREYGAIGPVGLSGGGGRLNLWREQTHHEVASTSNGVLMNMREKDEEEKRRDREDIMNSMLGQGAGLRGPRERAEDEERERRSREKEMRLRASNTTAFDPFHPVSISSATPSAISSRQSSGMNGVNGSTYMQPLSVGSSSGPSPLLGSAFPSHQFVSQPRQVHTQQQQDGIVGPWDKLTVNTAPGPSSSSQRSTSPPLRIHSHALMEGSRCYSPAVGETGHLYRENNEIQQQQYHAPSESSSSSIAGTQRTNANSSAEQSADSGTDGELDRASDGLALNTNDGNTSPQLPSPASGASSASVRNIVDQNPPINTLYVGNLPTSPPPLGFPQDYLEERLRDLFSIQPGYRRLLFRQKSNGPMCFVEFEDVQYATKALNDLYGNNLKGLIKGGGIRLSYSKNPLGVRTPTSAGSATGPSLQQQQNQISTNPLQSGGFPSENTSARVEEPPQQSQRLPSILRRESKALSPPPVNNHTYTTNFLASPPRFHAVATGAASQYGAQPSATQLTSSSAAFVPRGTGNTFYSYSLAASNGLSASQSTPSFSPFAMSSPPTHSSIPDQSSSSEASHSS